MTKPHTKEKLLDLESNLRMSEILETKQNKKSEREKEREDPDKNEGKDNQSSQSGRPFLKKHLYLHIIYRSNS